MNGSKKDVDPATELVEEDEDAALPELEQETAIDLSARAAPPSRAMPSWRRPRPASIA
jgi:hypothetical protein